MTLSSTERVGKSARFWKVRPMPSEGDPVRRQAQQRPALEQNLARIRRIEPGKTIEERGLAGAVGADQPDDQVFGDVEGYAVQRHDAAEMHRDIADLQNRLVQCCPPNDAAPGPPAGAAFSRCVRRRQRPAGRFTLRRRRRRPFPPVPATLPACAGRARARWPPERRRPAAARRPGSEPARGGRRPGCSSREIRPVASACGCAANCA